MGLHMQAGTTVIPTFVNKKWASPMESVESSYKRLNRLLHHFTKSTIHLKA